jgi:VWFA-related protein
MAQYCTPDQGRVLVTWITVRAREGVTLESATRFRLCSSDLRPMKTYTASILVIILLGRAIAQQQPTFSSQSNLVLVPTMVTDNKGNIVYGLHAQDFIIEDDGVGQLVHLDEAAEAAPVSLVVAVQSGRRAWREFARMRGLASMLDPVLSDKNNQAALLLFDSKLNLVRDFTNSGDLIEEDLKNLQPGDGGAAILDAVAYSVKLLAKLPEDRQRVLLLISETRDHGSHFAKLDDVITLVGVTNTAVYALPFSPSLSQVLDTERGGNRDEAYWNASPDIQGALVMARHALKKNIPKAIAAMTGGEYDLFSSRKGFETRMNSFSNHLHNRYLLSFEPKNPRPGLHQIRVRLKDPAAPGTLLFRRNYWASGPSTQ